MDVCARRDQRVADLRERVKVSVSVIVIVIVRVRVDVRPRCDQRVADLDTTPEMTRGNRKSQFHEFTGELTSKVNFHYFSRSQWLHLPNPADRRRIYGGHDIITKK